MMKMYNFFVLIVLLGSTKIAAEWSAVQCGPTTTPVLTNAGWQCQPARAGDPRTVYPNDDESYIEGPFMASDIYWSPCSDCLDRSYAPCSTCSSCSSYYSPCTSCGYNY